MSLAPTVRSAAGDVRALIGRFLADYVRNPVNLLVLVIVPVVFVIVAAGAMADAARLLGGAGGPAVETATAGWAAGFLAGIAMYFQISAARPADRRLVSAGLAPDRLVLARETWRATVAGTGLVDGTDPARRYLAVRRWRAALGLPERVFVRVATEIKPTYVDLTSPLYASRLCLLLRAADRAGGGDVPVVVSELLPSTHGITMARDVTLRGRPLAPRPCCPRRCSPWAASAPPGGSWPGASASRERSGAVEWRAARRPWVAPVTRRRYTRRAGPSWGVDEDGPHPPRRSHVR